MNGSRLLAAVWQRGLFGVRGRQCESIGVSYGAEQMPLTDDVLNVRAITNYLAHDVDCAVYVSVDGLAGGGSEQSSLHSATKVLVVVADGFERQRVALAGVALLGQHHMDTYLLALILEFVDELTQGQQLEKSLDVAAQTSVLLRVAIPPDDEHADVPLLKVAHDVRTHLVHHVRHVCCTLGYEVVHPSGIWIAILPLRGAAKLTHTVVVVLVVAFQEATVVDGGLMAVNHRDEVLHSDVDGCILGLVHIGVGRKGVVVGQGYLKICIARNDGAHDEVVQAVAVAVKVGDGYLYRVGQTDTAIADIVASTVLDFLLSEAELI